MEVFAIGELQAAKGLAFDGAQAHVVNSDGEIKATITLIPGHFDPSLLVKHLYEDEELGFENVRLSVPGVGSVVPVPRGKLETKANADWVPSKADRERRAFEAKLNNLEARMDGQVDRAVKAALAARPSEEEPPQPESDPEDVADTPQPDPEDTPDPNPEPKPEA